MANRPQEHKGKSSLASMFPPIVNPAAESVKALTPVATESDSLPVTPQVNQSSHQLTPTTPSTMAPRYITDERIKVTFEDFDALASGDLSIFYFASALTKLVGRRIESRQLFAIMEASEVRSRSEKLYSFTLPEFVDFVRTCDWDMANHQFGDSVCEHSFHEASLGFRIVFVPERGAIHVHEISDSSLSGTIQVNDSIVAINGAPVGFVSNTTLLLEKVKTMRPLLLMFQRPSSEEQMPLPNNNDATKLEVISLDLPLDEVVSPLTGAVHASLGEPFVSKFAELLRDPREEWEKHLHGAFGNGTFDRIGSLSLYAKSLQTGDSGSLAGDAFNADDMSSLGGYSSVHKGSNYPPSIPEGQIAPSSSILHPLIRQTSMRVPKTDDQVQREQAVKERQRRQRVARRRHSESLDGQLKRDKESRQSAIDTSAAKQWAAIGIEPPVALQRAMSLHAENEALTSGDADESLESNTHDLFGEMSAADTGSVFGTKGSVDSGSKQTVTDLEALVDRPKPGMECYVCKVRQKGCPLCWDFPKWKKRPPKTKAKAAAIEAYVAPLCPYDYAFVPGGEDPRTTLDREVDSGGDLIRPALHTALTTSKSIKLFRACFQNHTTYNIKTVPSGDITTIVLENDSTVFDLYETFRSNSEDGAQPSVHLYLPTWNGIYSLCNQDEQETDMLRANVNAFEDLKSYNIGNGFDRGYGPEGVSGKRLAKERSRNPITAALMAHDNEEHPIGHSTVSLLYYPWFAPIEASDAWKRRPKPSFGTVKFYIDSLFDNEEAKPTCQVKYTTKGSGSDLPETTSLPGPDIVQFRLKHVLEGERRLRRATLAIEEAEDNKKAKQVIEQRTKALTGAALKERRQARIHEQMDAAAAKLTELEIDLEEQKQAFDQVANQLHETKSEMARIDRTIISVQKQKTLRSSDVKAISNFQQQFKDFDVLRKQLDEDLRRRAKGAVAARKEMDKLRASRVDLLKKLDRVALASGVPIPPKTLESENRNKIQRSSAIANANAHR